MNVTQRGVLPPVNFAELDASVQGSILTPAGSRLVNGADFAPALTSVTNAGIVTLTGPGVQIATLGSMAFTLGQLVFVMVRVLSVKGAVGGNTLIELRFDPGTGAVQWRTGIHVFSNNLNVPASVPMDSSFSGFYVCTTAGTVTPSITGASGGSDSTVAVGSGALSIRVI